jgi:predicted metalloprotease with PDZ domain
LTVAGIRYRLAMPEPHTHLFRVEILVPEAVGPLELCMPSWTPGSYLLREFPRNVQEFTAEDDTGACLPWAKTDKNTWRVEAPAAGGVRIRYAVYANELTVRTSHLDASHGYVNGASVFLGVCGRENEPLELDVEPPAGWRTTTPLPGAGSATGFVAGSYHQLIDSPLEIGTHQLREFDAAGKPHRYAIWGRGTYDPERLIADTRAIVETQARFWGGLPYDGYTFILHLVPGGRGGLEHRDSTSLQADRNGFHGAQYEQFLGLVVHEFFHTWNATRIRPEPLVEPDYTRENYTRNLWVIEGLTTYYTDLFLCRSKLISADRYLERLGEAIHRLRILPGRHIQSLADSSFDTWIKFYRPDEHTPNSQVSYYQKGALVGLLLDMRIRAATDNQRSLDDVMHLLWERYGSLDVGFPEDMEHGIRQVAEEVCDEPLDDFFARYIFGTGELDFHDPLTVVGLELRPLPGELTPAAGLSGAAPAPTHPAAQAAASAEVLQRLGLRIEEQAGRAAIAYVRSGSAAQRAGLNARDEVVALGGLRVDQSTLAARLGRYRTGERVTLSVFRRAELLELELEVAADEPERLRLVRAPFPTPQQAAALRSWLWQEAEDAAGARPG